MPTTILPSEDLADLPTNEKAACVKMIKIPSIISNAIAHLEYMFTDNGDIGADFAADLCAANCCFKPPYIPPPDGACTITDGAMNVAVTPGDSKVTFIFSIPGGRNGYTYELYRYNGALPINWGAASKVASGSLASDSLVVEDATAVNDTIYYYRLTVDEGGSCPTHNSPVVDATPGAAFACKSYNLSITLSNEASGVVRARLNGIPASGYDVVHYISASSGMQAGVAIPATVGNYYYEMADLPAGRDINWMVEVKESPSCTKYTASARITTTWPAPATPSLQLQPGRILAWGECDYAEKYNIYVKGVSYTLKHTTTSLSYTLNPNDYPYTENNAGTLYRRYTFKVRAVNKDNVESADSNEVILYEPV